MRINLTCPFTEKDTAKALGARWDPARKTWFIENMEDLTPFLRWIPSVKQAIQVRPEKAAPGQCVTIGAQYVESSIDPGGLPWEPVDSHEDIAALRAIA